MTQIALVILTFLVGWSLSYPLDYPLPDLGYNSDGYSGPYSDDYYRRGFGIGLSGVFPGTRYGSLLGSDSLDLTATSADLLSRYPADYPYRGYPRTVDFAKENYVRGSPFGTTEVGTRDEVTIRSSGLRPPSPRYCNYYPFSVLRSCRYCCDRLGFPAAADIDFTNRRPFPFGLGLGASLPSFEGVAGDSLLLRR